MAGDIGRRYVAIEDEDGDVGFSAVNPHALDASEFAADMNKRIPASTAYRHTGIPAYCLSMVGTHVDVQGEGAGSVLLANELKRSTQASTHLSGCFLILDVIEDAAARLYGRFAFVLLPSMPGRMVVGIAKLVPIRPNGCGGGTNPGEPKRPDSPRQMG